MLWFAIEGPGRRLRTAHGDPVGPMWSRASINAPVALDLPENSRGSIRLKQQLVTILDLSNNNNASLAAGAANVGMPFINLCSPIFPLSRRLLDTEAEADVWEIGIHEAKTITAKIFFDTDAQDILFESSFTCMSFLILERKTTRVSMQSRSDDTEGLVMRLVKMRDEYNSLDVYERVGYFTTSYMPVSPGFGEMRAAFKSSAGQRLRLA